MNADTPINDPSQDLLRRGPIAERIADIILKRPGPDALVLALHGPWGSGKSSVLHLSKSLIKATQPDAIVLDFDPWFFNDDESLIRNFFSTAFLALERAGAKQKKVKKLVKKWGGLLKAGASVLGADVDDLLEDQTPAELREELRSVAKELGRRIVVYVDDLDRLHAPELALVMKLVRLCGDFPWFSYVLAYDRTVVSGSLRQQFPGRSDFLDKIVQVEVPLPPTPPELLARLTADGVSRLGKDLRVNVAHALELFDQGDPELRAMFGGRADTENPISTIRDVKRYLNGLACTLPLIGHEVHSADFALLEMLRVFFPSAHDALYERRLTVTRYEFREPDARNEKHTSIKELVEAARKLPKGEYAVQLLCKAFPQIQEAMQPMNYVYGPNSGWERERRAASPLHVDKYFQLRVPDDAIPRKEVVDFVAEVVAADAPERDQFMSKRLAKYGDRIGALFSELRFGATVTPDTFEDALWPALASISGSFDGPANEDPQRDGAINGAAFLLFEKVATRPADEQTRIIKSVVETATSDLFASYLVYLGVQDGGEQGPVLPKADWSEIRASLATRLARNLSGTNVTTRFPRWWSVLLRGWGDPQAAARHLGACFLTSPGALLTVAKTCVLDETSTKAYISIPEIARYADLAILAETSVGAVAPVADARESALVQAFLAEVRLVPGLIGELEAIGEECANLPEINIGEIWKRLNTSEWQQNSERLRTCFASRPWWRQLEGVYSELETIYQTLDGVADGIGSPESTVDALTFKSDLTARAGSLRKTLETLIPEVRAAMGQQIPREFSW